MFVSFQIGASLQVDMCIGRQLGVRPISRTSLLVDPELQQFKEVPFPLIKRVLLMLEDAFVLRILLLSYGCVGDEVLRG